ncbi:Response regulator receiver domain-containing protein [Halogranum amylolyticum]|uniref:Response regulator receiver domain-containing protein n=1 Tax=Halogranum amylolyticum TaxID=660520 RepID=A0A1H8U4P3_9EURY|nr:response regulator [Halogranum amylolyticum]SEO98240.1 Response regulator receiver domain-containing protein [Halogranum amylolyticum]
MTEGDALILAVASRSRNLELMTKLLDEAGYRVLTADDIDEFDELLQEADGVSLTVLDIDGFTGEIWDRCERLQSLDVPILVLAKRLSSEVRQKALSLGARQLLEKPVRKGELRQSVQSLVAVQRPSE